MHTYVARTADDLQRRGTAPQFGDARAARLCRDDVGEIVGAGIIENAVRDTGGRHRHRFPTQPLGNTQGFCHAIAFGVAQHARMRRLYIYGCP